MTGLTRFLVVLLLALPVWAQKDYLSPNEVDQVREAQEPVARIRLYLGFAKQRLDQLQSALVRNRPGRSGEVRQLLEDYTSIIDAINTVADDALVRKADLTAGPAAIAEGEKKFIAQLQKLLDSAPRDLDMYDFALKEAIAATSDSMDLAKEDPGFRSQEVLNRAQKENKQVADIDAAEKKAGGNPGADASEAAAAEATQPARKPPTLYRPGEKPDGQ
jgi:uncharacterized protein involved in exopolysaccharide biosynthesis